MAEYDPALDHTVAASLNQRIVALVGRLGEHAETAMRGLAMMSPTSQRVVLEDRVALLDEADQDLAEIRAEAWAAADGLPGGADALRDLEAYADGPDALVPAAMPGARGFGRALARDGRSQPAGEKALPQIEAYWLAGYVAKSLIDANLEDRLGLLDDIAVLRDVESEHAASRPVQDRLIELESLFENDLITDVEFAEKRQKILDEL